jgi:hypothetical protein
MNSKTKFDWPLGKSSAIMVADSIIDEKVCSNIITEVSKYYDTLFTPGPVFSGVIPTIKSSMDMNFAKGELEALNIPTNPLAEYEKIVVDALFGAIGYYAESFRWLWEWPGLSDSGFRLQHYIKNNGYYREHIDGGPGPIKARNRMLGAVIYLNTVEVGGETFFPEHNLKIPARAGSIALFPAYWTHPHQGCVPLSEDKWIISTFITKDIEQEVINVTPMQQVVNEEIL